jgi:NADH-quinone oxidoreductase subunit G
MPALPTEKSPKVPITVDDREVMVPGDTNLLEALQTVGIETPHICYHPYLPVSGNCRQCMVEVDNPRGMGLAIACYTPVRPGMKVATPVTSPRVKNARKAVSEFMLVNHPLDCPICDKAGECSLQENYITSGQNESRLSGAAGKQYHGTPENEFKDTKGQVRGGKRLNIGPRVILDEERCVQCDRCVRFMRHVAHDEQLQLVSRGDHTTIATFPGEKLDHPYDLCVTDVCPVGALTGKHFRFEQRVWMLSRTPSISMDDSLGANIWIDHNNGFVWRLMPRCNPEVNRSWLSNDSRLAYLQFRENRLLNTDKGISESASAVSKMLSSSAGKIAAVLGGSCTLEDAFAVKELQNAFPNRVEVFVGSLDTAGTPDGIAKSGDPVANRKGFALLGFEISAEELCKRAGEFETLVTVHADLWGANASLAAALSAIPNRIALSAFENATTQASTVRLGVNHWSEVSGTMVNCNGFLQKLNAAPVSPSENLMPAFRVLGILSGKPVSSASEAFLKLREQVPVFAEFTHESVRSAGVKLNGVSV